MKCKIEKTKDSQVEIICEFSKEVFSEYYEKTLLSLTKKSNFPGFRKGNVPKNIIEKNIGREIILYKAADLIINENYSKIISRNKLELIGQPKIEIIKIAKNNNFKFKIKSFALPEIKLPDYKEIAAKIKSEKKIIDQDEIQKKIKENILLFQKSKATRIIKNKGAEKKDWVEISFSSPNINNNQIEKQQFILGQGRLVPGFEDQIEGMKAEEEKNFFLKFPKTHSNQALANKKISFNLKVKGVYALKLPPLDDSFAKNLGKFKDLKDLKQNIKTELIKEKKEIMKQDKKHKLLQNIIKDVIIDIPKEMLEQEKNNLLTEFKENLKNHLKISIDKYLEQIKKTEEEFEKLCYQKAEINLKGFFILYKIAKEEKIILTDEEIKARIEEIKKQIDFVGKQPSSDKNLSNQPAHNEETKKNNLENLKSEAKIILTQEKIFDLLLK